MTRNLCGGIGLDAVVLPAVFLHNGSAAVVALVLSSFLRVRWLVALLAWAAAMAASFLWKGIGPEWLFTWGYYVRRPVLEGGLWRGDLTQAELTGLLAFWLLPLAFGYLSALARVARVTD